MKSIYIAHSMTNGQKSIGEVLSLANWLKSQDFKVAQPSYILYPDFLVSKVLKVIEQSDTIIADVSHYSHGVGFELGYAYSLNKEIIVISNISSNDQVSKFILGLFPEVIFYKDLHDLICQISPILIPKSEIHYNETYRITSNFQK